MREHFCNFLDVITTGPAILIHHYFTLQLNAILDPVLPHNTRTFISRKTFYNCRRISANSLTNSPFFSMIILFF